MCDIPILNKFKNTNNTFIDNEECILITIERLRYLELLESKLPEMIEAAIQAQKNKYITAPFFQLILYS